ncbi:predicted transcriptional regulator [Longilinea arvoryzae]|uniref:Predicted transcriptional regulator n=1 Tax=Longilinea arvoryzae TaxID=360412 RepID=A0A0S7BDU0_9CHLR|nr:PadR family transcriptional regulator [Longilinea arvoryzae]GAP12643.1 predicted transcriptional regulator [Longilinea arvoryzae]
MKLEYILLGLINIHPSVSGYELKAIINQSTGYFFSASLSQIYPALKLLANQGWITYEVEPLVGKQDRKVYTITPDGQRELGDWLRTPLKFDPSLNAFEDFLLKLTFMGILDDESILAYLESGLSHFQSEKTRVLDNNLANEKAYLKMGPLVDEHHIFLWSFENDFLIQDLDRKIGWIEELIAAIRNRPTG